MILTKSRQALVPIVHLLSVSLLTLGVARCGGERTGRVVNIVTAPPGGGWYVMGGILADIINQKVAGVQAIPEATGGAEENVRLVGSGQSDLGFVIAKTALQGYQGQEPFTQAYPALRMLFSNLEVGRIHAVVLEGSPLKDLCELKGKRVAVGPSGHGSLLNLREIFSAGCDFTFDDITPIYLSYGQALETLGDGRIDAAVLYIAPPIPALGELGATDDFRLLPINEQARDKIVARYDFYLKTIIPAKAYKSISEDVPVVGTANAVMVNADLPEDLVYEITRATFENLERLRTGYPTVADFSIEAAAQGGLIPYHDGAVRYFRERGVWTEPGKTPADPSSASSAGRNE